MCLEIYESGAPPPSELLKCGDFFTDVITFTSQRVRLLNFRGFFILDEEPNDSSCIVPSTCTVQFNRSNHFRGFRRLLLKIVTYRSID